MGRKTIDLTSKKFGKLTVVSQAEPHKDPDGKLRHMWNCSCDCGKSVVVYGHHLRSGKSTSCGCQKRGMTSRTYEEISPTIENVPVTTYQARGILKVYVRSAKARGISFVLTDVQAITLLRGDCYYCGSKPNKPSRRQGDPLLYNGIDRLDNRQGYTLENSVSCCSACNLGKGTKSAKEFLEWVEKIHEFQEAKCDL